MSSERDSQRLAEYESWERLEARLWSRARWIGAVLIVGVVAVFVVGVPMVRTAVSNQVRAEMRPEIREMLSDHKVDLPTLRRELRDDTDVLREQLVANELGMQKQLAALVREKEEIQRGFGSVKKEQENLQSYKVQLASLQLKLGRLKDDYEAALTELDGIRGGYETAAAELERETERTRKALPRLMQTTLRQFEDIVLRELDEVRGIMADHSAGNPALFSTFIDLDRKTGNIVGSNFGDRSGRIMLRVRAFRRAQDEPVFESKSILLRAKEWDDSRIELDLSSEDVAKLRDAEREAEAKDPKPAMVTYGFLVMRADGQMSQWSGKWSNSLVPPEPRESAAAAFGGAQGSILTAGDDPGQP